MDLPAGTRNHSYAEDMAIFRTKTHWFLLIALLIVLFTAPTWFGGYWLSIANLIGITIIAVTGLNILTGYCGQLSIGHAGFMAVGAYTSAILTTRFDQPFLVGLICAGFMAGIIGILFGIHRRPIYHSLGYQILDSGDRRVRRNGNRSSFNRRYRSQESNS
jgi:branched-chain amino acid transport system permease protein